MRIQIKFNDVEGVKGNTHIFFPIQLFNNGDYEYDLNETNLSGMKGQNEVITKNQLAHNFLFFFLILIKNLNF